MSLLKCVWGTQQALSKGMDGTRQVSLEMDASRDNNIPLLKLVLDKYHIFSLSCGSQVLYENMKSCIYI